MKEIKHFMADYNDCWDIGVDFAIFDVANMLFDLSKSVPLTKITS